MGDNVAGYDGVTSKVTVERGIPQQRSLGCLPQDVLARVILKLPVEDILRLSYTCKSLREVAMSDSAVWLPLVNRFMERCTIPALWMGPSGCQEPSQTATWPSSTYRSSAAVPHLEEIGHGLFVMNPGVSHAVDRPSRAAQQHCAAAIGLRASPVLGSSPPGSFESELLTFLSGQSERPRQSRRAARRRSSGPPGAWPERMYLRRAAPVHASGTRGVLGVWTLVHHNSPQTPANCTIDVSFSGTATARRIQGVAVGALASSEPLWSVQLEWAKESGTDLQDCLQQLHLDVSEQLSVLPEELSSSFQSSANGQTCDTCEDLLACMGLHECQDETAVHNRSSNLEPANEDSLASLMNGMDDLHVEGPHGGWEVTKVFAGNEGLGGVSIVLLEVVTPTQQCKRLLLSHPDGLQMFARLQVD